MKQYSIPSVSNDASTDIAAHTISIGKQAIVFVNSKRGAEATADRIAKTQPTNHSLERTSEQILSALSSPTKQCRRLAAQVLKGVAFHHAGLAPKQRELIENSFKKGDIKIICATPTLAAGINLPSFRTIIRDLKRYSGGGMISIPTLEYHQMAGRSGRPDFNDDYGEAIILAKNEGEAEELTEQYLYGEPEAIYSKISSQPVLRTYCLSLVATNYTKTLEELQTFFESTFFAHQYGDTKSIQQKISTTVEQLQEWGFIKKNTAEEFTAANELTNNELLATPLGKRVSQLYLDPLTANHIISGLYRTSTQKLSFYGLIHLITNTIEMRPLLRVKTAEYEELEEQLEEIEKELLYPPPSVYDHNYDEYLEGTKTANLLKDWCEEAPEEKLLEEYNCRPGELYSKLDKADWLLYGTTELARILSMHHIISPCNKARTRITYGAKKELLPLLRYKGIGRVRARTLYKNKIRNTKDIQEASAETIALLIGTANTKKLKEQVGQTITTIAVNEKKRTGQLSLQAKKFQ